jgi:L-lactate utilization protein LutC
MSFLNTLSLKDRRRLRTIVKKTHLSYYPKNMITDYEADKLVEAFGEETVYNMLKSNVGTNVD